MLTLDSIDDNYMFDSAKSIVAYFLSNAGTWRGEKAKEIKKELKGMIGLKEHALEEEDVNESGYDDYLQRYQDRLSEMNAHPELLKHVTIEQVNNAAAEDDIGTIDTIYELLFNKA